MSIDTLAVRDRVTARTYGWSNTTGAPEAVKQAAADYQHAIRELDDALVEYELEVAQRKTALRDHNEAVSDALRAGKKPPVAKVPSLEEIEVRHGAVITARESFVQEAASRAERAAQAHYPHWRAEALEQLQAAAAALAQATAVATQTAEDWGGAAETLARLDRHWAPRAAQLDDASLLVQLDRWSRAASVESTQLGENVARQTSRLRELSEDPVVREYDPRRGTKQYTAGYLAQQAPVTGAEMRRQAAESIPAGLAPDAA